MPGPIDDPWQDDDPRLTPWRTGSYEIVGDWFRSASIKVLDGLDLGGRRLLDLATGTGAVSIEAARRGADVTGIDLTPDLLDIARERAVDAGVSIDLQVGDFDHVALTTPFDIVTSSFGLIFSADPTATAAAVSEYLTADGTLVMNAWAPDGAFGQMSQEFSDLFGNAPVRNAGTWSTRSGIEEVFAETSLTLVEQRRDVVAIPFESPTEAADQMIRWSGVWSAMFAALESEGKAARGRELTIERLASFGLDPASEHEGFVLGVDHVISTLTRPS